MLKEDVNIPNIKPITDLRNYGELFLKNVYMDFGR